MAGLSLSRLLPEFPHIEVEKVEYLTHRKSARDAGVRSIPTLAHGDRHLTGVVLGKKRMRRFLESL